MLSARKYTKSKKLPTTTTTTHLCATKLMRLVNLRSAHIQPLFSPTDIRARHFSGFRFTPKICTYRRRGLRNAKSLLVRNNKFVCGAEARETYTNLVAKKLEDIWGGNGDHRARSGKNNLPTFVQKTPANVCRTFRDTESHQVT
jgi:hypothetical protein